MQNLQDVQNQAKEWVQINTPQEEEWDTRQHMGDIIRHVSWPHAGRRKREEEEAPSRGVGRGGEPHVWQRGLEGGGLWQGHC